MTLEEKLIKEIIECTDRYADNRDEIQIAIKTAQQMAERIKELEVSISEWKEAQYLTIDEKNDLKQKLKESQQKNQRALKNLIELRENFIKCNIPVGGIDEVFDILQTKQNQEG